MTIIIVLLALILFAIAPDLCLLLAGLAAIAGIAYACLLVLAFVFL